MDAPETNRQLQDLAKMLAAILVDKNAAEEANLESIVEALKPGQGVLHSFAKPNTGEKDFAASLQKDSADSSRIRFVFEDDPVTKVPPVEMGYDPGSSSTVLLGKNRRRQSSNGVVEAMRSLGNDLEDHNEINYFTSILTQQRLEN